jgi:hypothetical protein
MVKVIRNGNIMKVTACGQDILVVETMDAVNIAVTILQCAGVVQAQLVEEGKWEVSGAKTQQPDNAELHNQTNRIKRFLN